MILVPTPEGKTKKVAIIQSNYVPWVGYFSVMASVDLFVVYECVQYTKNDWRNRNQLYSPDGRRTWLSIPIRQFSTKQAFMETKVSEHNWAKSHFKTLHHHFARTQGWSSWRKVLESLYDRAAEMTYLFEVNRLFLGWALEVLGIRTRVVYLDSYPPFEDPNERLISILQHFGATHYLSGPTAKSYIRTSLFDEARIDLSYVNYDDLIRQVLAAPQPFPAASILQLIVEGNHEFRCN